ncbi:hypothetical protein M3182_07140 [Mesobacillus maritimus]|uniref:hypothetical protein n=1 Tax=Mesobacillus maritimus TaxID=1643336 RepID=UPI00203BF4AF|nr:hypothetical protein [Mesobacillus maritimus]MCM3585521.1 hypothetical protein [Mesobacillus maritimus]MCM3669781.1 hypothetical protein [Mesobacillus maritimus]
MQIKPVKSILLIGAGAAAVWVASNPKENITRLRKMTTEVKERWFSTDHQVNQLVPVQQSAHPDPYDEDNNEMVSEGSIYGIHYYNENLQS